MHVDRAVAYAAEAVAKTEVCALVLRDELGERFNRFDRRAASLTQRADR